MEIVGFVVPLIAPSGRHDEVVLGVLVRADEVGRVPIAAAGRCGRCRSRGGRFRVSSRNVGPEPESAAVFAGVRICPTGESALRFGKDGCRTDEWFRGRSAVVAIPDLLGSCLQQRVSVIFPSLEFELDHPMMILRVEFQVAASQRVVPLGDDVEPDAREEDLQKDLTGLFVSNREAGIVKSGESSVDRRKKVVKVPGDDGLPNV